jgi:hypothetical protein
MFPFGSTALPDLDRPRPWVTGVGCTGTGSTGTCTADAVPKPPETGATIRGVLAAGIPGAEAWGNTRLRTAGFKITADRATLAANAQVAMVRVTLTEKRFREF